jgi:hypothetical protein
MSEFDPNLIYTLKGSTLTQKFERLKFGLLVCAAENRGMTELELLEFEMIIDQIEGVKDPSWINSNVCIATEAKQLFQLLFSITTPEERSISVKNFLTKSHHLKIHNAYYGRTKQNPVKSLLRGRNRMSPIKSRPKRFIGVGYRDKGNKRNVAEDGSPRWEEVYNPEKDKEVELSPMQKQFLGAVFGNFRNHYHHEAVTKDPKDLPKNPFLNIGGLNAQTGKTIQAKEKTEKGAIIVPPKTPSSEDSKEMNPLQILEKGRDQAFSSPLTYRPTDDPEE